MKVLLEMLRSPEGETGSTPPPPASSTPSEGAATTTTQSTPPSAEGTTTPPAATETTTGEVTPPKAGAGKDASAAPAPLTLEGVKLPEGFELHQESANGALEVLNKPDLTPQQRLQELVNWYAKDQERLAQKWIDDQKAEGQKIIDDPEIGKENFGASETAFATMRKEFGSPELDADLVATGMGNKLSFARFLVKLHKAFSEGKPIVGAPTSGEAKTAAQKLYPEQGKV